MFGVRKTVPVAVLMHEVNRTPLHLSWLKQSLRFWNKVCARPVDDLVRMAMQESLNMGPGRVGWVYNMNTVLSKLGLDRGHRHGGYQCWIGGEVGCSEVEG